MNRRVWLRIVAVLGSVGLALGLWAFWFEPGSLAVVEERANIPWRGRPLRLAILTDLHVGSPFNGIDNLKRVVDLTNAANPDLVCLLGDLVIQGVVGGRVVEPEAIAAELSRLKPEAGAFAVLGNHDGWLDRHRVSSALARNNIRMVEDTAAKVETPLGPVWIAGVSDLWTGKHDLAAAMNAIDDDDVPVILLTHNPDIFPRVPKRVSLTLAGHTHGGQVRLPFFGRPVIPSRFGQRYAAGHVVEDGKHLFVATGIGTSIIPVRLRVPPAVTILSIEPDQR